MSVDTHPIPHRKTSVDQDDVTGVLIQNPESTRSAPNGFTTPAGAVDEGLMGHELVLAARVGIGANSPAASTTYTHQWFNKNCPYKLKVLEVGFRVVDLTVADFTDGDNGNLDVTIIRGDGAESETETDVLADVALDDDYSNGTGDRYPSSSVALAADEVVKSGSLKAQLIVDPDDTAGATNDGAIVDVWVRCVPTP